MLGGGATSETEKEKSFNELVLQLPPEERSEIRKCNIDQETKELGRKRIRKRGRISVWVVRGLGIGNRGSSKSGPKEDWAKNK